MDEPFGQVRPQAVVRELGEGAGKLGGGPQRLTGADHGQGQVAVDGPGDSVLAGSLAGEGEAVDDEIGVEQGIEAALVDRTGERFGRRAGVAPTEGGGVLDAALGQLMVGALAGDLEREGLQALLGLIRRLSVSRRSRFVVATGSRSCSARTTTDRFWRCSNSN